MLIVIYPYLKPMKTWKMALYEGGLIVSPKPKGGLGPKDVNRHKMYDLYCKIGKSRYRAGHIYEPAGNL